MAHECFIGSRVPSMASSGSWRAIRKRKIFGPSDQFSNPYLVSSSRRCGLGAACRLLPCHDGVRGKIPLSVVLLIPLIGLPGESMTRAMIRIVYNADMAG
ncbi:uncharacterized protein BP01DRAFT_147146 [Aspergillus saccharolyticus JOP 1030-1]|uniref:Uncharacterized protein n=1 Tax=Aspergillus saccharolyticus JOP 1030-1 TaxID=1450539 RepID=A0A318ZLB2_9EURO|nr:hypothetical protein BP01DRAFT_147146 [Aspergillus saccharolyticus JOP 1030-1]PYH48401.1 hypothetical protein BP01DRAFT_147146 [Aspergillus saccharolyticus JOP 1030-1]